MGSLGFATRSLPLRPIFKPLHFSSPHFLPVPRPPSSSAAMSSKTLEEPDVGISCFLSTLPGFRAVLKQRYADFIVREVDRDGNIARLTSLDVPAEDLEEAAAEKETPVSTVKGYAEELEAFRLLVGDADAELLQGLLTEVANVGKEEAVSPGFVVLSVDGDKTHRAEVHNFFKRSFKFLITDTIEEVDGSKRVRVRFAADGESGRGRGGRKRKSRGGRDENGCADFDSRGADSWPECKGRFVRFHLYKENKDTQEALGVIGKMLGIQPRSFGFAGTKDKRAITTQKVTVFKVRAKRLAALNSRLIGIKVGDFSYVREGLVLGQLLGNHFTITLREVVADSDEIVNAAAEELGMNGFINYFGLQRFGSGSIPTHRIGSALLKGEWEAAVGLILDPRDGERDFIREVREYYKESGDIDGTLRRLPRYLVAERAILQCLSKCPGNYLQGLKAIPRTLRMMYAHSYQSYIWNHAASARVQTYGIDKVVLGDLVFCKGEPVKSTGMDCSIQLESPDDFSEGTHDSGINELPDLEVPHDEVPLVKIVDCDDLLQGCYTIEDIVLPLPGSRVIYPGNDVAKVYYELSSKDCISLTECVHNAKEFSITNMTGGYRRVFQKPMDFSWELLKYTDASIPLVETDLDAISGKVGSTATNKSIHHEKGDDSLNGHTDSPSDVNEEAGKVDLVRGSDPPVQQTALKLCFTLPSSSYATMAIRELLKSSTSVAFHKKLNTSGNGTFT